jgi:hypothetical protein
VTSKLIKIHVVSTRPGNPIFKFYVKADRVESVGEAPEEYAKIGAASSLDTATGTLYVTENVEDLRAALEEALKELV